MSYGQGRPNTVWAIAGPAEFPEHLGNVAERGKSKLTICLVLDQKALPL